jgi:hypothetical protein
VWVGAKEKKEKKESLAHSFGENTLKELLWTSISGGQGSASPDLVAVTS